MLFQNNRHIKGTLLIIYKYCKKSITVTTNIYRQLTNNLQKGNH